MTAVKVNQRDIFLSVKKTYNLDHFFQEWIYVDSFFTLLFCVQIFIFLIHLGVRKYSVLEKHD